MSNSIMHKAAQHTLCEELGFDEGRAYYLILTRREKELSKDYSHSKKYRLLKNLFKMEALGKIKTEEQDFFSYILLPPTFLRYKKADKEIIKFLEEIYLNNFGDFLSRKFTQLILKDEKGLVVFVLKYLMKDNARISGTQISSSLIGKNYGKIEIKSPNQERRKIGIIDGNFAFEFSSIRNKDSYDYIGYIANQTDGKDYISILERELSFNP